MREFAEKLVLIERRLAVEQGPFTFFGLVKAKSEPELWDLVVSASWLPTDESAGYRAITEPVTDALSLQELIRLSRVVILKEGDPFLADVQAILSEFNGTITELPETFVRGTIIPDSYIITNNRSTSKSPLLSGTTV